MSLPTDRSGEVLGGRYTLVRRIGTGGMGAVYEAIQGDLGRRVALKILHQHLSLEPTLLERFRREALASAALGHPNIVSVSDLQSPELAPPFLVMELLTGMSLKEAIADGPIDPRRVAHIAAQVLSALGAAHHERIVHRDIKPDNIILIDTNAMRDFVKVLDFGVAKLQRENVEGLTVAGSILGTLSYMAPEQAKGDPLDGRADVYSVGACMYHALTGRKPFDNKKAKAELYAAVILEPPPPLAAMRPGLDPALVAIVERAMQKRAIDRYATADEMVSALVAWQMGRASHPSLPPPGPMRTRSLAPVTPTSIPTIPIETPGAPTAARVAEGATTAPRIRSGVTAKSPRSRTLWVVVASVLAGVLIERVVWLATR